VIASLKNSIRHHPILFITLAAALAVYSRFLFFGHISWDDPEMVFKNKAVQDFDLQALFTRHFVGNYIPLTMLVHALAWQLFGDQDGWHHILIILLHLANGVLVYQAGRRLLKNEQAANLGCIIFLLHPLQVESVGWISELKNVLSTLFYLAALLRYLDFTASQKRSDYLVMALYFILGCLSKSSVVVFPLSLACVDILLNQRISYKFLVNKLPLLLISVLFGFINLKTQAADLFINYSHAFPYYQRTGYAGYALVKYLLMFIFPADLSVIYPYPQNIMPALIIGYGALAGIGLILFLLYRKKRFTPLALALFTLVNLALVLQFVPFGEVLYADRYMYVPVIGLAWLTALIASGFRFSLKPVTLVLVAVLGLAAFARGNVWRSAITLYEDILKSFPNSFVALNSVGVEYMFRNNDEKAFYYLDKSVKVAPHNYKGFYNRGLLYLKNQQPDEAIENFNRALAIYDYLKAYVGRASAFQMAGNISKAMEDANHVLAVSPGNAKAHFILGNCYNDMNRLEDAMKEYNKAIALSGDEAEFYFKRGIVLGKKQDFEACIRDINVCLELNPEYYEAYYWRGVAKVNTRQNACGDFKTAAQKNYKPAVEAFNTYCR
jgi:tetratricopeptide (TPR) repeat protein